MSDKRKSAAGSASRFQHLLCDRDCNHCPLVIHPNTRLLSALLNQLHHRFGEDVYRIVETACPNLTCCADCHIDDFCHVDGCEIVIAQQLLEE